LYLEVEPVDRQALAKRAAQAVTTDGGSGHETTMSIARVGRNVVRRLALPRGVGSGRPGR
jgi:hypothetical protein